MKLFFIILVLFGLLQEIVCNEESGRSEREDRGLEEKPGQCPYIFYGGQSCNFQCQSDSSCKENEKCCSNGCGTECMTMINLTMCQHQHKVATYNRHHSSVSNGYIPKCKEDGSFEALQCDPVKKDCWCVDFRGFEISQTRTPADQFLNCSAKSYSGNCPLYKCIQDCDHGFELDKDGCRTCTCRDPCSSIHCTEYDETCKLMNVECSGWPCPPIAMCLRNKTNPCDFGEPLQEETSSCAVACGADQPCLSTHLCKLSVFADRAFCCPRPQSPGCPNTPCNISCPNGFSYEGEIHNVCPLCECHEPCKNMTCPKPSVCRVQRVTCCCAPCLPIAGCSE